MGALCRIVLRSLTAAAILLALVSGAAAPDPETGSLVGQLLIAAPTIGDPRFARTVILMVKHNKGGAFGIVINRPIGERSVASLLAAIGEESSGVAGTLPVLAGGPVQPELGFVIHSAEYQRAETLAIDEHVAMSVNRQILRDIARRQGPERALFAFGYAGWGPGQIEAELDRHDWFTTPEDPKLIFGDDRSDLWDDAMARRTREL